MKKIIILLSFLFIFSCSTSTENKLEEIIENEEVPTSVNQDIQEEEKVEKSIGFDWSEDTDFTYCDSLSNYENNDDFYNNDEYIKKYYDEEIVPEISQSRYNFDPKFIDGILEYCRTSDSKKYIFVVGSYSYIHIYELETDTMELKKAISNNYHNSNTYEDRIKLHWYHTSRNYGDTSLDKYYFDYIDSKESISLFWLKNKNIIPFSTYWVNISWLAESAPWVFAWIWQNFEHSSQEYCDRWLTPEWKLAVCFMDVFYDYDFVENIITDSRVCSYYIDDNWEIKTLEKCFDITENYKWYTLKNMSKWFNFYQNETWDISILDVDLNIANISFGWVNTVAVNNDDKMSSLYRFNRFTAETFYKNSFKELGNKKDIYAFVNGQFFNPRANPTALSFPVKSDGKIINSYVDNDKLKKTFIIDNDKKASIKDWYDEKYLNDENNKEVIVWINPEEDFLKEKSVWRSYIWIIWDDRVVFFVAENKTQAEMKKIANDYWIKDDNLIMMDWWPSAQLSTTDGWRWNQFYGAYWVPQFFVIYNEN